MTPSGVIANLAFSTTFTYGLPGRPGVLTSVSAGESASHVYAPPSSFGMQNALTEMFLVANAPPAKSPTSTRPLTAQETFSLPVWIGVLRLTVSGAPWRTFALSQPTIVCSSPDQLALAATSTSNSAILKMSWPPMW